MTRINLLPPERVKAKRVRPERTYAWLLMIIPLVAIAAIAFWYFSMNSQLKDREKALQDAKTELADWQAKNAQLQVYKQRQQEIENLERVIVNALKERVYWARILNEIAIMCPSDIWLTSLSCSASGGAGTVQFQGYALQCPNRMRRGMFVYYPDYRPIAGWLEKMIQIPQFERIWISGLSPTRQGVAGGVTPTGEPTGQWTISFGSQAVLNMDMARVGGPETSGAPGQGAPAGGGGEAK